MALDEKDIQKITDMIGTGTAKLTEQVGALAGSMKTLTDTLGETINTAIDTKTKPLADTLAKIGEGSPDDKDKGKAKDKPAPGEEPEWFKKYRETQDAALKPVLEFTESKKKAEADAAAREAAKVLVVKTLTEKKLGGLVKNEAVMARLIAGGPRDEAAVLALVENERKYAASLGLKVEAFGADVAGEGGTSPDGSKTTPEQKKQATAEAIKKAKEADAAWR